MNLKSTEYEEELKNQIEVLRAENATLNKQNLEMREQVFIAQQATIREGTKVRQLEMELLAEKTKHIVTLTELRDLYKKFNLSMEIQDHTAQEKKT